jgi:hypothetical protein
MGRCNQFILRERRYINEPAIKTFHDSKSLFTFFNYLCICSTAQHTVTSCSIHGELRFDDWHKGTKEQRHKGEAVEGFLYDTFEKKDRVRKIELIQEMIRHCPKAKI